MRRKADPLRLDLSVVVSHEARLGLGKERGRAGMATAQQIERYLYGVIRDELARLAGVTEGDDDDGRDDDR